MSVDGNPVKRPRPSPLPLPELTGPDESYSSDSSASSAASIATVRPLSGEQPAPDSHWTRFFDQELYHDQVLENGDHARYHVYITLPSNLSKGPLFICHHGAGASGLSFAVFAQEVRQLLPEAGILSLDARGHGDSTVIGASGAPIVDFSLETLVADVISMIRLTAKSLSWPTIPPTILIGHSLGGAVMTTLATDPHYKIFGNNLVGYSVLDVVEGSAIEALTHMRRLLTSRPQSFDSVDAGIKWHISSRTLRDARSAAASVPSLLRPTSERATADPDLSDNARVTWRTDLSSTAPWWEGWFTGLSKKFLIGHGAKLLILAGTDRLDKELMIGQMQGKFQLVVIPEAGHFVQEDVPARTAELLVEFWRRNDRGAMVLPPKVSDLLKMGKKV
ncbi:protein phosphatase methylesterase [Dissoconium aciculare CBS 342.82]|uniref:Protein phosphatase methylesterase 1 n=1 Tax=Dissoconium aciculare CBS 342.82 TaxID=1314786 RepID=A0A6J3LS47_9PEZI|nr:protein phosphatase methylesterase [Dissoconium aciculare CBS 342.82]KAF1818109.1 protein phosphatase methylesterase [Dissoconium aciculare CBS 342.82]